MGKPTSTAPVAWAQGWRWWLPIMPTRYALVALGGGLLLLAAQLADHVAGAITHDWRAFVIFAATVGALVCFFFAGCGPNPRPLPTTVGRGDATGAMRSSSSLSRVRGRDSRAQRAWQGGGWWLGLLTTPIAVALGASSILATAGGIYLIQNLPLSHAYLNDVISFTYVNAKTALAGRNPYTNDGAFAETLRRFPMAPATPLRRGVFGHGYAYPLPRTQIPVDQAYIRYATGPARLSGAPDPTGGAFDPRTLHSYPALSFLLYAPLIWLGVQNVVTLHLLVYGALFAWLVWLAPPDRRRWAALAVASAAVIPFRSLAVDAEIICLAFLLLAWRYRANRWVAAIALGLACAFKQYCWLFAPFLLLDAWLTYGWREALRRGALALVVFLAPNLPYLIASPDAWLTSMALPVSDPLFPMGIGVITLSLGGWLPYLPSLAYTALEVAALVGALWAYARWRAQLGEMALLLGLAPLFFAFRSPINYFAIAPWLALYAANEWYRRSFPRSFPHLGAPIFQERQGRRR